MSNICTDPINAHSLKAEGLIHTSPGRSPWLDSKKTIPRAESAIHLPDTRTNRMPL